MLLLVAALPVEFGGFRRLQRCDAAGVGWMACGAVRGRRALLVANGMGRQAARAGARAAMGGRRVRAIVSTGFAGALDSALPVGSVIMANSIVCGDRRFGSRLPSVRPPDAHTGTIVTVDRIVRTAAVKRRLAAAGCRAVDMESAALARLAQERGLPFYCVRGISDAADRDLPLDIGRAALHDGTLSANRLLRLAVSRPGAWGGCVRLWRDARIAARSLAEALGQCEFEVP